MSGINTNRTNISLPADVSSEILAKTQEDSAVMRLARRIALPGRGATIPMITADPEASWVDETAEKPVSNPSLSTKVMQAYKLAVIVPFSNEFRRDLGALYDALVERLPRALALKFDKTVFNGPAPGGNFDTFAAVSPETISGAGKSFYGALVNAETTIANQGASVNGYAMSPQGKGEMLSALDSQNRPIFINNVSEGAIPRLLGQPVVYSQGVYGVGNAASGSSGASGAVAAKPDVLGFAGDWTQAVYGTVEGVQIDVNDSATLTVNDSAINLWQRNMFAVRAEIEVGFRADTNCFAKIVRTHA